jgi:hypothetical protein
MASFSNEIGNTALLKGVVSVSLMGMMPNHYTHPTTKYVHHTKWGIA